MPNNYQAMDLKAPVSTIMKTQLITVSESDPFEKIRDLFSTFGFRHLPVVQFKSLKGLISLSDIAFLIDHRQAEMESVKAALIDTSGIKANNLMKTRLGKLEPTDRISVAVDIFLNTNFHCLPVVNGEELVGLVTPNEYFEGVGWLTLELYLFHSAETRIRKYFTRRRRDARFHAETRIFPRGDTVKTRRIILKAEL